MTRRLLPLLVLAVLGLAACGEDDEPTPTATRDFSSAEFRADQAAIRDVTRRYLTALSDGRTHDACTLLTARAMDELDGDDCAETLGDLAESVGADGLAALRAAEFGDPTVNPNRSSGTMRLRYGQNEDIVLYARQGETWLIDEAPAT